ncbi:TonB-dependent receptor plug domain-containing protein [Campylobacter sp. FMV-PI01]|uniref:TonB-dependent receptor plug domain-containing protein n=1 Tax=Campylobacter portucalensis TaxID=2608384 RepID=A0A6L5WGS3_9BACT|nr:TonB-dependent receptor plug domain-containing protein [Campylobacter portucalensis]MSN96219.1 TonB-dependent receptor plug domain-containing protein [Campylobacter portucalensis]
MKKIYISLTVPFILSANGINLKYNSIMLDKIDVIYEIPTNIFASSTTLSRQKLDTLTTKNHTIGDALKMSSNIAFKSENGVKSGEIKPENFSISGAKFYQNNFMIDGVNFNHDLNPANKNPKGVEIDFNDPYKAKSLSSQAITLDTDLLENLEVIDSSASAKYGDFQGGVVKATTRDPKRDFSGVISYQYTSGDWTHTYRDKGLNESLYKKSKGQDKSNFVKKRYRVGLEGYISKNLGLLFNYSKFTSVIKYDNVKSQKVNNEIFHFPNDKEDVQNYYLKAIVHANDKFTIKPSILYSMQTNRYFEEDSLDSTIDYKYGGYALNLETDLNLDSVFIKQNLSYSKFDTSRYTQNKSAQYKYELSNIKNWGSKENGSIYGSVSDIEQLQEILSYKFDLNAMPFQTFNIAHNINSGFEISQQKARYKILKPYIQYPETSPILDGYICKDGDLTCVNDDSYKDQNATGQFHTYKEYYGDLDHKAQDRKIAFYLEDEIIYERLKLRPGIRIEKNNLVNDILISPRFASEYEFVDKNFLGFGLNRYYGRNLFTHYLYVETEKYKKHYSRETPKDEFKFDEESVEIYGLNEIKNPYDDEFSVFYRGDIENARVNLKYIKRKSKDEVREMPGELIGRDSKIYYTNNGKSKTDIYILSVENTKPIEILNTKNHFSFNITKINKIDKTKDYKKIKKFRNMQLVEYEGKTILKNEIPWPDYKIPLSAKFSHNMSFRNFTITNHITFTYKINQITQTGKNKDKIEIYEKTTIPSKTLWDMRISYEQNLKNGIKFFSNLDINNVLNKKYPLNPNRTIFGTGRNFWLEAGLRW